MLGLDRGGRAWTAVALCYSIVGPHGFPTCTRHATFTRHENDNNNNNTESLTYFRRQATT